MAKKRISLKSTPKSATDLDQSFIGADAEAEKIEALKKEGSQKGGRPTQGKSKAVHDVRFKIDDETFNALMEMSDYKTRTVHAVAKKILMAHMNVKD